ncbi:MAG: phosphate uptake regulator PhoU [Candidatus Odinarchaeum yellowstonii]|uniref:Phosphate uptake regulator PhoU n=1 Tax=Odinarchaeota yellowstonii (strain LCB_4) TaxID=1841599 RepID=A0AAF0D2U1_ODILC|nr:MAG: phosphate uptake regulator PhoU [Candidatus Odinarchaeum yellowstonii]
MSIRKIQEVKGSYYVYLLKDWCNKNNLKANSLVKLEELPDGSLVVKPHEKIIKEKSIFKINVENLDLKILKQIIKAVYAIGADIVEIKVGKNIKLFELTEFIIKILATLPGLEIVEEFKDGVKLQNTGLGFDLPVVIRKLFTTVYSMLSSLSEAVKNNDIKLAESIINRDTEVDRNYMIVERLSHLCVKNPFLLWGSNITIIDILHFNIAGKYIERIGDHIVGLAYELVEKGKLDGNISELIVSVISFYEKTNQIFFTKNFKEATPLLNQCEILEDNIKRIFSSIEDRMQVFHIRRIMRYCIDLAQIAYYQMLNKLAGTPIEL